MAGQHLWQNVDNIILELIKIALWLCAHCCGMMEFALWGLKSNELFSSLTSTWTHKMALEISGHWIFRILS